MRVAQIKPVVGFWGPGPGVEAGPCDETGGVGSGHAPRGNGRMGSGPNRVERGAETGGMGPGATVCGHVPKLSGLLAPPSNGCCWASHGPKPAISCPTSRPAARKAEMPAAGSWSCRMADGAGGCPTPYPPLESSHLLCRGVGGWVFGNLRALARDALRRLPPPHAHLSRTMDRVGVGRRP